MMTSFYPHSSLHRLIEFYQTIAYHEDAEFYYSHYHNIPEPVPFLNPSLIGRVMYYAWLINLYARQPATRAESNEGRFAEIYIQHVKKPAEKDYPVVDAIRLTRYGRPLVTFASNEFQMAILLNIAIVNLLQECENQANV